MKKVYVVEDNFVGISPVVFSNYDMAKKFLLERYSKTMEEMKEYNPELRKKWATLSEVEYYFEQVNGIEDFGYIIETIIDDTNSPLSLYPLF